MAQTHCFIQRAMRCLKRAGLRRSRLTIVDEEWHSNQTKMCGCREPLPCASISPRKASTGPKSPGAHDAAATPSVHHSLGAVTFVRRRFCRLSGRTPSTCTKKSRMMSSKTRV